MLLLCYIMENIVDMQAAPLTDNCTGTHSPNMRRARDQTGNCPSLAIAGRKRNSDRSSDGIIRLEPVRLDLWTPLTGR